ncbi:hypothetical protein PTTW11_03194 [Pyrenophora teres f. teres]|uniref:Lipoprotein n=1 Tax=Pyrenophora teres f. teres TaxID=97479 RepID=A0A6S6VX35_9PLEO|nr:hypothetical protein PTTW11_03194 [Pyrenophora teres f. teres]
MKLFAVIMMVIPAVLAGCEPLGNTNRHACHNFCAARQDQYFDFQYCVNQLCNTCET